MSIIYEALKKTQDKREEAIKSLPEKRQRTLNWKRFFQWKKIFIALGIIVTITSMTLGGLYLYAHFTALKAKPEKKPYMLKLTLSGVFVSNQEKTAMINDRMLHVGDNIGGLNIVSIDYNGVVLSNGIGKVVLHQ